MARRTLIVTLPPFEGGVPAKTRILAKELARRGHDVTVAYYAPLSSHAHLCAPAWTLRRPRAETGNCFDGRFRAVAVGGTVLASNVLVRAGVPHLTWCASDMRGDRLARRQAMAAPRRLFDRLVVGGVQAAMERAILAGAGRIVTVGAYMPTAC